MILSRSLIRCWLDAASDLGMFFKGRQRRVSLGYISEPLYEISGRAGHGWRLTT